MWYAELLEKAALAERNRVLLRIQEHNELSVYRPLEEISELKNKVRQMNIIDIVD